MNLTKYIKNKKSKKQYFSNIEVNEMDPLPDNISIKNVLKKLSSILPSHLLSCIDTINIGQFKEIKRRKIQAYYDNKAVFMTNNQVDEDDMIDDIVHEIAHAVEEKYGGAIYLDGLLKEEFVRKRLQLKEVLQNKGFNMDLKYFIETKYSEQFDKFLHVTVGYPILRTLTSNIYYSPYAATSLREYFANGFEAFYLFGHSHRLKKMSPELYRKLGSLLQHEDRT